MMNLVGEKHLFLHLTVTLGVIHTEILSHACSWT